MKFQSADQRTLDELKAEIASIEGFPVRLECNDRRYFKPYPTTYASPPKMKGAEWVEFFEKHYPEIDVTVLSPVLTLGELRKKPAR